jgi:hypothetical protein
MWQKECTLETGAGREEVWSLWKDVKNWKEWNVSVIYSHLNGDFRSGTSGSFKMFTGLAPIFLFFELLECVLNRSFVCRIKLLLCTVDLGHELIEEGSILKIKQYVKLHGPLSFYYKKKLGSNFSKDLRRSIHNLKSLAEKEPETGKKISEA